MAREIRVREYHNDPIAKLTLPNGEVWVIRQPREADFYRLQELLSDRRKRVIEYSRQLTDRALAAQEAQDDDTAGRDLIEKEGDEDQLPLDLTTRWVFAATLAIFCEPAQPAERILEELGPNLVYELYYMLQEVLGGESAKKKLAGTSPAMT